MKKIYLVDTENVHSVWIRLLTSMNAEDEMVLFYTNNSQGLSYSDLQALMEGNYKFEMVKCFTGRNGLDFQLSSYLGYLIKDSKDTEFNIIANDNGYDALVRFWNKHGISVKRLTVDSIKKMSADSPEKDENPVSETISESISSPETALNAEKTVTEEIVTPVPVVEEVKPVEEKVIESIAAPAETNVEIAMEKGAESPSNAEVNKGKTAKNNFKKSKAAKFEIPKVETSTTNEPKAEAPKKEIQYKVMNPLWGELQSAKKASLETEQKTASVPEKKAAAEKEVAAEQKPATEKKAAPDKKAVAEKKAAPDKKATTEKKAAPDKKAVAEKKATTEKKAAPDKKTTSEKKAVAEKKATPDKKAATDKKTASEKKTVAEKKTASEMKTASEKKTVAEKKSVAAAENKETKKAPIKNKSKALSIIKDTIKDCSFKVSSKDHTTILEVLAYEVPERDLRTINNRLVKAFDQQRGSELYKLLKQAKAITEIYRLLD